jgi:methyltransferase (TIGR00027 family)
MDRTSSPVENISDTAHWVALYRAIETERRDAHFHDPYARMLAGERGEEIMRRMRGGRSNMWAMVVRTCVYDEIILRLIQHNSVDTVLNLAAGLDTRPYRLQLPATVHWIEVDLPAILTYKEEKLANEQPTCHLERVKLNLAESEVRKVLFARVNAGAKQVLVITEGLMIYLTAEQATSLATDLHAEPHFRYWLTELTSPFVLQMLQRSWNSRLATGNARVQFAPEDGVKFYERLGWRVAEFRLSMQEAHRLRREMRYAWLIRFWIRISPPKRREMYGKDGFVLLERE